MTLLFEMLKDKGYKEDDFGPHGAVKVSVTDSAVSFLTHKSSFGLNMLNLFKEGDYIFIHSRLKDLNYDEFRSKGVKGVVERISSLGSEKYIMAQSLAPYKNIGEREDFPYDTWLQITHMPMFSKIKPTLYLTLHNESTNENWYLSTDFLHYTKLIELKEKE
jgi:hypothetical protein